MSYDFMDMKRSTTLTTTDAVFKEVDRVKEFGASERFTDLQLYLMFSCWNARNEHIKKGNWYDPTILENEYKKVEVYGDETKGETHYTVTLYGPAIKELFGFNNKLSSNQVSTNVVLMNTNRQRDRVLKLFAMLDEVINKSKNVYVNEDERRLYMRYGVLIYDMEVSVLKDPKNGDITDDIEAKFRINGNLLNTMLLLPKDFNKESITHYFKPNMIDVLFMCNHHQKRFYLSIKRLDKFISVDGGKTFQIETIMDMLDLDDATSTDISNTIKNCVNAINNRTKFMQDHEGKMLCYEPIYKKQTRRSGYRAIRLYIDYPKNTKHKKGGR